MIKLENVVPLIDFGKAYSELYAILNSIYDDLYNHKDEYKIELIPKCRINNIIANLTNSLINNYKDIIFSDKYLLGLYNDIKYSYNQKYSNFDNNLDYLMNNYINYASDNLCGDEYVKYKELLCEFQAFSLDWYLNHIGVSHITKQFMILILK